MGNRGAGLQLGRKQGQKERTQHNGNSNGHITARSALDEAFPFRDDRSRKFIVLCKSCGTELIVHLPRSRHICKDCERNGSGWKILYDKATRSGKIPANLVAAYHLDKAGREN
jgi:hypothetical protein